MYEEQKMIDLDGYAAPTVLPDGASTYPYYPPIASDPWYTAPLPLPVDEPYIQTPIINDTVETPAPGLVKFTDLTYISGTLIDADSNPVNGATMAFRINGENTDDVAPVPLEGNSYIIETTADQIQSYGAMFRAKGFIPIFIPFPTLRDNSTVTMTKEESFPFWIVILVIGAVYLYRKNTKKVGALGMGDLFPIFILAGGIIAFDIIKKILIKLGIWDSKDTKDLDAAATDPNSAWSPTFYKTKPSNIPWSYAITTSQAKEYSKTIYDSFGAFNDCEECAKGVIRQMRTKSNVSYLAEVFSQQHGEDLLSFLRGGWWPQDRLSDADVNELNNYVNQLPKY